MTDSVGQTAAEKILAHAGELKHVGVKGMRWGFRKKAGGGYDRVGRTKGSADYQRSRAIKAKKLRDMSNDELKELNNRLQLETKYRQLNPNKFQKGQRLLQAAMGIGTSANSAMQFGASPAGQQILQTLLDEQSLSRVNARLPIKEPKK